MKLLVPIILPLLGLILGLSPLSASGRAEGAIQKTWDYADVKTVVVDADRQDIVVKEGGLQVTGRVLGDTGDEVRAVRNGDTVTLTVRGNRGWFSWRHRSTRVELSVPAGTQLDLTTASGAILVQVATGSLRARSASGDIEAARGGMVADVDSTSGTVRLKGFSGPIKASTLSGDLLLESLSGDLQASTLSGDLEGRNLHPADHSRFTAVSGGVDLELQGGSDAYSLQAESVSGGIEVGDSRGQNQLDNGKTGSAVVVKTVSGDIRVR